MNERGAALRKSRNREGADFAGALRAPSTLHGAKHSGLVGEVVIRMWCHGHRETADGGHFSTAGVFVSMTSSRQNRLVVDAIIVEMLALHCAHARQTLPGPRGGASRTQSAATVSSRWPAGKSGAFLFDELTGSRRPSSGGKPAAVAWSRTQRNGQLLVSVDDKGVVTMWDSSYSNLANSRGCTCPSLARTVVPNDPTD